MMPGLWTALHDAWGWPEAPLESPLVEGAGHRRECVPWCAPCSPCAHGTTCWYCSHVGLYGQSRCRLSVTEEGVTSSPGTVDWPCDWLRFSDF